MEFHSALLCLTLLINFVAKFSKSRVLVAAVPNTRLVIVPAAISSKQKLSKVVQKFE